MFIKVFSARRRRVPHSGSRTSSFAGTGEAGLAPDEVEPVRALQALLAAASELVHNAPLAGPDHLQVHFHGSGPNPVVGGAASEVGGPGARDHRLGGGATHIDAGTAHIPALDYRRTVSGPGEGFSALTRPDHHGVVICLLAHWFSSL